MGIWSASLVALFTWWFATGLILLVIRRADRTGGNAYNVAVFMSVPVLALGVAGVIVSTTDTGRGSRACTKGSSGRWRFGAGSNCRSCLA